MKDYIQMNTFNVSLDINSLYPEHLSQNIPPAKLHLMKLGYRYSKLTQRKQSRSHTYKRKHTLQRVQLKLDIIYHTTRFPDEYI